MEMCRFPEVQKNLEKLLPFSLPQFLPLPSACSWLWSSTCKQIAMLVLLSNDSKIARPQSEHLHTTGHNIMAPSSSTSVPFWHQHFAPLLSSSRCLGPGSSASQWGRNQWCGDWVYSKCNLLYSHLNISPYMRQPNSKWGNSLFQQSHPTTNEHWATLPQELTLTRTQDREQTLQLLV